MDAVTLENLILREIRKTPEISRRDLADQLEIARSTAGRRVDSLIERKILREKGLEEKDSAGRPRRFLELVPEHGGFIGLDFDARRVFGIVADFAQNVIVEKTLELEKDSHASTVLGLIREFHHTLTNRASIPILATGIGIPGRVDRESRIGIDYPYIREWKNINLLNELEEPATRLFIDNNTRAAALGEVAFGKYAGIQHLVCLNVRTGISAAVISSGVLLSGKKGMAGEIRDWPALGKTTTLEATASIRTIDDWALFAEGCQSGEASALAQLDELSRYHGGAISQIVQLVDPEVVVLSGPFTQLGDLWLDRVQKFTAEQLDLNFFDMPKIDLTQLSHYSGAMGAAAMAADQFRF